MKKLIIAMAAALAIVTVALIASGAEEEQKEAQSMVIETTAKAVEVKEDTPEVVAEPTVTTPEPTPEPTPEVDDVPNLEQSQAEEIYEEPYEEIYEEPYEESCSCFDEDTPTGDEHDLVYIGEWTATGYCPCEVCNGGYSGTASGAPLTPYWTVACNSLPMGSILVIDGQQYQVQDTGWSPYGDQWLDICFGSHEEAYAWGVRTVSVYMWQ